MFHVVLSEVPLHADVFGLLADQGIPRVSDCTLFVLQYGGCPVDWLANISPISWRRRSPSSVVYAA
jgi:hypothetical protein